MQNGIADSLLKRLARLASRAGVEPVADEARALAARVTESRFYLVCVGQFKRGKSTLLDALLDDPVLPIGVLPVTAIPTIVRYGPARAARVLGRDREWVSIRLDDLASYVAEEENPENQKAIVAVEVFLPSELLATGMCLVDTPGLGSVSVTNSAATYNFLPHIDAALIVLGADPPITGEELSLAARINEQVENVLFVLNKADRVSEDDLLAARDFACSLLGSRLGRPIEIYEISAKEKLEGTGHGREWPKFAAALSHLVSFSGRRLVWLAQQRGSERLAGWLRTSIGEEIKALTEPIEQAEASVNALNEFVHRSEQATRDLDLLLFEEQQRLMVRLEQRRQEFMASILPSARNRLMESAASAPQGGPALRHFAAQTALSIARDQVTRWLEEEQETVEEEYTQITERFTGMANDLLGRLALAGIPQLAHVGKSIQGCGQLSRQSQFQFNRLASIGTPASPLRYAADLILAALGMTDRIWNDADQYLQRLIDTNTSRVQYDLERRLAVARKELELGIRGLLATAKALAHSTLVRALETRAAGDAKVRFQLTELSQVVRELDEISAAIARAAAVVPAELPELASNDV